MEVAASAGQRDEVASAAELKWQPAASVTAAVGPEPAGSVGAQPAAALARVAAAAVREAQEQLLAAYAARLPKVVDVARLTAAQVGVAPAAVLGGVQLEAALAGAVAQWEAVPDEALPAAAPRGAEMEAAERRAAVAPAGATQAGAPAVLGGVQLEAALRSGAVAQWEAVPDEELPAAARQASKTAVAPAAVARPAS